MGNVIPPPHKGKLPFYNHSNLQALQEEADKLEAMGFLAKPADVGIDVQYASPSFLVMKPNGGVHFAMASTKSTSCNKVLQKLFS